MRGVSRGASVALLCCAARAGILEHSRFIYDVNESQIKLRKHPELHLNVKGGELAAGSPLVLWPCNPHSHEIFDFDTENHLIRLRANKDVCLNAESGLSAGARITTWPCMQHGELVEHERFTLGSDGRIRAGEKQDLCINVKGGNIANGGELILWHCSGSEDPDVLDRFEYDSGLIKVKKFPDFHFNIVGGSLTEPAHLVLWVCHPGAHEVFEFVKRQGDGDKLKGQVRLKLVPELCLNAEGGVGLGHRIVVWPCSEEGQPNEDFDYDPIRNVIYSAAHPNLGFNVKGGNTAPGGEIVLWSLVQDEL